MRIRGGVMLLAAVVPAALAAGQSSSLFLEGEQIAAEQAAASRPAPAGALTAADGAAMPGQAAENEPLNQISLTAVPPQAPRKFKVHDAVSIIVIERLRYQSQDRFQQDKRWDLEAKLSQWFRIHDNRWHQQDFEKGTPEVQLNMNDRRTGNGQANRQDELTTRITAEVIDVKPNGQLVLQAQKKISFSEESQVITLVGWCRGQDVTPDNSVLSTQLMNLEVDTENDGQARSAAGRGWFQKVFDKVRPF